MNGWTFVRDRQKPDTHRARRLRSSVLWYSLSSLGTYSTCEGDALDDISRGGKIIDEGDMSG